MRYIAGESDSKKERTRYCCGEGVSPEPKKATRQIISVQKSYKKATQRQGKKACMDDADCVKLAAMQIADIFCGQYQVYYGVHEDEEHLHILFASNTVSYVDGRKWHKSKKEIEELEVRMREKAREALWR